MSSHGIVQSLGSDVDAYAESSALLQLARKGEVTQEHVRRLVIGEYHCTGTEIATYGALINRFRHEAPAGLFAHTVHRLAQARKKLLNGAVQSVGLRPEDLTDLPLDSRLERITEFLSWVGLQAGSAEAAAVIHADYTRWWAVCRRLSSAAREQSAIPEAVVEYLDLFREEPREMIGAALETIDHGLTLGEDEGRIVRTARKVEPFMTSYFHLVTGD